MKKKFVNKRYFLNPREGVAAASFQAEVNVNLNSKKDYWPGLDGGGNIELSDCNRQISLDFNIWVSDTKASTLKDIHEKRAKLERLQSIVNEFAEATDKAYDFLESQLDAYYKAHDKKVAEDKKVKGKKKQAV